MTRVAVVAGNFQEFMHHARERATQLQANQWAYFAQKAMWRIGSCEYWYVNARDQILGRRFARCEKWGRWYLNPEARGIEREVEIRADQEARIK